MRRRAVLAGLAATAALGTAPALAIPETASARMKRRYLDAETGQIHIRVASPAKRTAISKPPLILLHQSPLSGRMFDKLLPLLADRRLAIAVDTPGYGESDRPRERPSLAGYSDAILDAVTRAYGRTIDVAGYHTGAAIAVDMAARHARQIRKVVLISVPHFAEERRKELVAQLGKKTPYAADGSHLPPLWTGTYSVRPPGQSIDDVARIVAEKQRVGMYGEWALLSGLAESMSPALAKVGQPTLVMTPHDGLEDESRAAAELIVGAVVHDMPELAYGLFDAAPGEIAKRMLAFLG